MKGIVVVGKTSTGQIISNFIDIDVFSYLNVILPCADSFLVAHISLVNLNKIVLQEVNNDFGTKKEIKEFLTDDFLLQFNSKENAIKTAGFDLNIYPRIYTTLSLNDILSYYQHLENPVLKGKFAKLYKDCHTYPPVALNARPSKIAEPHCEDGFIAKFGTEELSNDYKVKTKTNH